MNVTRSLRDRASAGVAWSAFHIWGSHTIQLGAMLVLARLLEPHAFGLFAMSQVVLVLLYAVVDQGIPEALVQADRDDAKVWWTGLVAVLSSCLAGAAILALGAPFVSRMFGDLDLILVLRWLSPALIIYGVNRIYYARVRVALAFSSHAWAGIAAAGASFLVGVPCALLGWGVWALVASLYAGQIVETLILGRSIRGIPRGRLDWGEYRRLLRFGRFMVAGSITTFLNRRSDDYFVGLFLGAEVLGLYTVAYQLLELLTTISLRAVERVAFPVFSKLKAMPTLLAEGVHTSFRYTSLVAFPAFVGLILVAPDLVPVALGSGWEGMIDSVQILAVGGIALSATNVLPSAIRALGHPLWNVSISASKGILLAIAFAITAQWGIEAVAWTFSAGTFAAFPLFFLSVRRLLPISLLRYLREGAGPLAAAGIMALGMGAVGAALGGLNPLSRLLLSVTVGSGLYVAAILLFARTHVEDLKDRLRALQLKG